MFTRGVSMRLMATLLAEHTKTIEDAILTLLRKQVGFQGQITLDVPGSTEAVTVSLWDKKENAEAYNREINPQLRKTLEKFIGRAPAIQTDEVVSSTFYSIAAQTAA